MRLPDNARRAARLYGAAQALRETIGSPLPAEDRAYYEEAVADVHTIPGEASFEAAWAEGRAMPLEQAVAYALEEPPAG